MPSCFPAVVSDVHGLTQKLSGRSKSIRPTGENGSRIQSRPRPRTLVELHVGYPPALAPLGMKDRRDAPLMERTVPIVGHGDFDGDAVLRNGKLPG